jgi:glycosyltransferase involved in cell wall biosynthesis
MKIALAHDSFTQMGGAERVIGALHEIFPDSEVYTTVVDEHLRPELKGWRLHSSLLQRWYDLYPHFQHWFPFIPVAFALGKAVDADLLVSSSSSYSKGLKLRPATVHISYCHTPTRFLWIDPTHADQEIYPLLRPMARAYFRWLRQWDLRHARRVDYFIANSVEVQKRIKQCYHKDSVIIHSFVDTEFWRPTRPKQDYFLIAGRLQRAKNHDVVVKAFNSSGLPLHVVGTGRYERYLRSLAGPNIKFLGRLDDAGLRDEYSSARGFIYPQLEDFGMMPLEAAACGTATIALAQGGSLETIMPGVTGTLIGQVNESELSAAISRWNPGDYDQNRLREHARKFSKPLFKERIAAFVSGVVKQRGL